MRASVARLGAVLGTAALLSCRHAPAPSPIAAPTEGTLAVEGISAPVRVARDRWGVPHIYAERQDDLFFAQGFVQAEDRLFQMDLWRRAAQGRLAEVLGSNFVARDTMTRRVQYRGDLEAEWRSYGADTRSIATAFVRGVNAWVDLARQHPPEEFVLAGWTPETWRPEDLLNRTDAFLASGDALGEVFHAQLIAALGRARAAALVGGPLLPDPALDPRVVTFAVGEALRGVGTAPFFAGLAGTRDRARPSGASNAWAVAGERATGGAPLLAVDPHRPLTNPGPRYVVHLVAPGWNVIGATAPWLPGVALGHNERVAWGLTAADADTEDLFVERLNPENRHQVDDGRRWVNTIVATEHVWVKGRAQPVAFDREYTRHGVIVAVDGERHLAYAVRWSGAEPGGAAELAATAVDRARNAAALRTALDRWKMPPVEAVFADRDGAIGSQVAALVPVRRASNGATPGAGWTGGNEWIGWLTQRELPHDGNPRGGAVVSANGNLARTERLRAALASARQFDVAAFEALQHDVVAWNAQRLVPLLVRVQRPPAAVDAARRLEGWDRRVSATSPDAALYLSWESALRRLLAGRRAPAHLSRELAARAENQLVPAMLQPSHVWFDGDVIADRDGTMAKALESAVDEERRSPPDRSVTFAHVLAVSAASRRRFDVGPFSTGGYRDTVLSITPGDPPSGASFRAVFDTADWDASVFENAPGQSESPASRHFQDLAVSWSAGDYSPLVFGDAAVRANTEATLMLVPRRTAQRTQRP